MLAQSPGSKCQASTCPGSLYLQKVEELKKEKKRGNKWLPVILKLHFHAMLFHDDSEFYLPAGQPSLSTNRHPPLPRPLPTHLFSARPLSIYHLSIYLSISLSLPLAHTGFGGLKHALFIGAPPLSLRRLSLSGGVPSGATINQSGV